MKKSVSLLLSLLFLSTLAACNGRLEMQVEQRPSPDAGTQEMPLLEVGMEETPAPWAETDLGRLAYVQEGEIWVKTLPGGAPQRLTRGGSNSNPRWSPSGEWLIFERDFALWAMRKDGSDTRPLLAPGFPRQVAWSPTEDRVAYITEQGELVVTSPSGHPPGWLPGTLIRSTTPDYAQQVTRFAWSPDGQWLACEILQYADLRRDTPARQAMRLTRRDGAYVSDLQTTEVDPDFTGSGLQLVGWSGDGAHILFWQGTPSYSLPMSALSEGLELMSIPDSGGDPRSLVAPFSVAPNLVIPRPASAEVALVTGGGRESPLERQLMLVSPDQLSPRLLSGAGQLVTAQVPQVAPAWSPDSQTIAYAAMPAPQAMPQGEIFDDEILNENLDERRIWVVEADGSGRRQLTNDPACRDEWPRWSADGQYILFIRVRDDQAGLWLMDDDGSHLQQVVEQLNIAPGASYFDGNRLFDWWTGSESPALPEGRLSVTTEQGGAAQRVVVAFLQAVVDGDAEQALSYWNLEQPEAPDNYAEFIRQKVTEWATGEHQFTVELVTYGGLVAPGDYRTMDEDDPRVQSALVDVLIDGLEHSFSLEIVDGHWQIEGLITP